MAKTYKRLFESVVSFENLWLAWKKARRGKRYAPSAAQFDLAAEEGLLQLQEELASGTWTPGAYRNFTIHEPKKRLISAAPFRDRVVHHAVVNILEPIWEARFSQASYACRKGKGTHAAVDRAHWGIRNCAYYLKGDIVKFFPSVDHEILLGVLGRKVGDERLMSLLRAIVASGREVVHEDVPVLHFAGDDLFSPHARARGLPIGNLTSQFFANVLLNELDQFVHREIRPREYVRYADDFVLFDSDKGKLLEACPRVLRFLEDLRLRGHPRKTALRAASQGLRFLGFRLMPSTRRVSRESISRFRRRMRKFRAMRRQGEGMDSRRVTASVRGWLAHAKCANSHALIREVLADVSC